MLKRWHAAGVEVSRALICQFWVGCWGGDAVCRGRVWVVNGGRAELRAGLVSCCERWTTTIVLERQVLSEKLRGSWSWGVSCPWDKRGVPAWFPQSREEKLRNLIPKIYFSIMISCVLHPDSFSRFHWSHFMVLWCALGIQGWALWRPCSWGSRGLWSRQAVAAAQILGTWKNTSPRLVHWLGGRAGNVSRGTTCQLRPERFW